MKATNHFSQSLGQLPEGAISHEEGLASLRKFLDARSEKKVTTETLLELAEIVLKNIFQFNEKTLKQLRDTTIGTKFAPPYATIFMDDPEERILNWKDVELQPRIR